MFLARRPSAAAIYKFIEASRQRPLSYSPVGIASSAPPKFDVDESAVVIGSGQAGFERAKNALAAWKHFDLGWVELHPAGASIEIGATVAMLAHHLGFWSLNGCRVVYAVGDRSRGPRFGFAYGTLDNHAELGEEIFEVSLDQASQAVTYRIRAVSRPTAQKSGRVIDITIS